MFLAIFVVAFAPFSSLNILACSLASLCGLRAPLASVIREIFMIWHSNIIFYQVHQHCPWISVWLFNRSMYILSGSVGIVYNLNSFLYCWSVLSLWYEWHTSEKMICMIVFINIIVHGKYSLHDFTDNQCQYYMHWQCPLLIVPPITNISVICVIIFISFLAHEQYNSSWHCWQPIPMFYVLTSCPHHGITDNKLQWYYLPTICVHHDIADNWISMFYVLTSCPHHDITDNKY